MSKPLAVYMLPIMLLLSSHWWFFTLASSIKDYCAANLCPGKTKHIACKNSYKFSKECPRSARIVTLTDEMKYYILKLHNNYRHDVATGQIKSYQKAARMATLRWDNELALFAKLNVHTCRFEIDLCKNTNKFRDAGQTIDRIDGIKGFAEPKKAIYDMVRRWFMDHKNGDMSYIKKCPNHDLGRTFENFAQLVRDDVYAVGCAMARMRKGGKFITLFTCNYSVTITTGKPIYKTSKKTASGCKTGINKNYYGLCSIREIYDNPDYYGPPIEKTPQPTTKATLKPTTTTTPKPTTTTTTPKPTTTTTPKPTTTTTPKPTTTTTTPKPTTTTLKPTTTPEPTTERTPEPTTEGTPEPTTEETPEPTTEETTQATTTTTPEPTTQATSTTTTTTTTTPDPTTEETPEPTTESMPELTTQATPAPTTEAMPEPTTDKTPEPTTEETPEPTTESMPEATTDKTPEQTTQATPAPTTEAIPEATTTRPTESPPDFTFQCECRYVKVNGKRNEL